jgi:nucleoside-diphosphate-sugar epimerase
MSIYLITGGAGFIGSHIADALLQQGEQVRILDNLSSGNANNLRHLQGQIEFIQGDICNLDTVCNAMRGADYVLHHAAIVSVAKSVADPISTHLVTAGGTLNVLLAARDLNVKRVVCASSAAVYGDNTHLPLRETERPTPLSPYAAAKLVSEHYASVFTHAYGVPTVCLRYFNVYGARQDASSEYAGVIAKFIALARTGQQPTIFGDGAQTRDFVHVSDVVQANLLACHADRAIGCAINIATGQFVSLLQVLQIIQHHFQIDQSPIFGSARPGDIRHSSASIELAQQVLGYQPQTRLQDGLFALTRQ